MFEVVSVAHAVITEGGAEGPNFGADGIGGYNIGKLSCIQNFEAITLRCFLEKEANLTLANQSAVFPIIRYFSPEASRDD